MSPVTCRTAAPEDAEAISSLLDELGYQVNSEEVRSRIAAIQNSNGSILAAVDSAGRVIGCRVGALEEIRKDPLEGRESTAPDVGGTGHAPALGAR